MGHITLIALLIHSWLHFTASLSLHASNCTVHTLAVYLASVVLFVIQLSGIVLICQFFLLFFIHLQIFQLTGKKSTKHSWKFNALGNVCPIRKRRVYAFKKLKNHFAC